jgi:hypothetical protein
MLATHAATQANSTKSVMKKGIAFCISFYPPSSAILKGKRSDRTTHIGLP